MLSKLKFLIILPFLSSSLFSEVVARLIKIEGRVNLKLNGKEYFDEIARVGFPISNGDGIKVGPNGFCAVMYVDDKSVIKIRENSKFYFIDTQNTRTVDLKYGTLLNNVKTKGRAKKFRIQTPVSVASVKGTQFAAISSQSGIDQFIGKEGLFEVLNMVSGETVSVGAGQKAISNTAGSLIQAPASENDYPDDPEIEKTIKYELKALESKKENNNAKTLHEKIKRNKAQKTETNEKDNENIDSNAELENFKDEIEKDNGQIEEKGSISKPFSMGLGIGSATLDGILYNQIALRPTINIWKVGLGLDLVLYVDNEGNFRENEWKIKDDLTLLLDKILFIKYGKKSDSFWAKYGSIENLTLGYGGLMENYSNMMEFPTVRKVGINTGFNLGAFGGEVFLSNLKDFSRGGTLTGSRLSYTISESIPLSFGISYVTDINMFSGLKDRDKDTYPDIFDDFPDSLNLWNDTDADGIPDPHSNLDSSRWDIDADGDNIYDFGENGDTLINLKATPFSIKDNKTSASGLTFDVGYPILQSDFISLLLYAEYNSLNFPFFTTMNDSNFIRIERSGSGISVPGIRSTIMGFINFSVEYRIINGAYIPQFFDQAYDLNRVSSIVVDDTTYIKTKDMSVFEGYNDSLSSSGFFGSLGASLFNVVDFSVSYANMSVDTTELKNFSAFLNLNAENIPKLSSAMAYYQRNNDDNPFDFENPTKNTILGYRIGYEMSKGVSLIWDYRQFYRDDGTGNLEPIKQTTIETSFNF